VCFSKFEYCICNTVFKLPKQFCWQKMFLPEHIGVMLHLISVVLIIFKRSDNILLLYDTGDEMESVLLQYKAF
jgi:hypothetical protein